MRLFLVSIPLYAITIIGLLTFFYESNPMQEAYDRVYAHVEQRSKDWTTITFQTGYQPYGFEYPYKEWCVVVRVPTGTNSKELTSRTVWTKGPIKRITLGFRDHKNGNKVLPAEYSYRRTAQCPYNPVTVKFRNYSQRELAELEAKRKYYPSSDEYRFLRDTFYKLGYFQGGHMYSGDRTNAIRRWQIDNGYSGREADGVFTNEQYRRFTSIHRQ